MKHPTRETWMAYLYGEEDRETERPTLQQHLAECAECRAQVASWESVRQQLDTWSLPARRVLLSPPRPWLPLAAAAVVFLAIGLALGRYNAPAVPDLEALRNELHQQVQVTVMQAGDSIRQLSSDGMRSLLANYALLQEDRRREDLAAIALAMGDLETQHTTDHAALRRDLETVAVMTDASFRQTQDQMVHLASLPLGNPTLNNDKP